MFENDIYFLFTTTKEVKNLPARACMQVECSFGFSEFSMPFNQENMQKIVETIDQLLKTYGKGSLSLHHRYYECSWRTWIERSKVKGTPVYLVGFDSKITSSLQEIVENCIDMLKFVVREKHPIQIQI